MSTHIKFQKRIVKATNFSYSAITSTIGKQAVENCSSDIDPCTVASLNSLDLKHAHGNLTGNVNENYIPNLNQNNSSNSIFNRNGLFVIQH